MTKNTKIYKLKVKVGKKRNGKVFNFTSDDPVADLLSIDIEKLTEPVTITLEKDKLKATRILQAYKARRVFNNELDAYYLIRNMHFILKPQI